MNKTGPDVGEHEGSSPHIVTDSKLDGEIPPPSKYDRMIKLFPLSAHELQPRIERRRDLSSGAEPTGHPRME